MPLFKAAPDALRRIRFTGAADIGEPLQVGAQPQVLNTRVIMQQITAADDAGHHGIAAALALEVDGGAEAKGQPFFRKALRTPPLQLVRRRDAGRQNLTREGARHDLCRHIVHRGVHGHFGVGSLFEPQHAERVGADQPIGIFPQVSAQLVIQRLTQPRANRAAVGNIDADAPGRLFPDKSGDFVPLSVIAIGQLCKKAV